MCEEEEARVSPYYREARVFVEASRCSMRLLGIPVRQGPFSAFPNIRILKEFSEFHIPATAVSDDMRRTIVSPSFVAKLIHHCGVPHMLNTSPIHAADSQGASTTLAKLSQALLNTRPAYVQDTPESFVAHVQCYIRNRWRT